jgi:hypothetical protein
VNPFASLKSLTGRIPLATVSGVATTNEEMIRYFDREIPAIDLITTRVSRSCQTRGIRNR